MLKLDNLGACFQAMYGMKLTIVEDNKGDTVNNSTTEIPCLISVFFLKTKDNKK